MVVLNGLLLQFGAILGFKGVIVAGARIGAAVVLQPRLEMIKQRFAAEGTFPIWPPRGVHLQQAEVNSQLDFLGAVLGFELSNGNLPRLVVPILQEVRDVEIHGRNMDAVFFQVNGRSNRRGHRAVSILEPQLGETPSTKPQAPENFQSSNTTRPK